jgi:hypothetical protein
VKTVMKYWVSSNVGKYLKIWATRGSPRRTWLHGVSSFSLTSLSATRFCWDQMKAWCAETSKQRMLNRNIRGKHERLILINGTWWVQSQHQVTWKSNESAFAFRIRGDDIPRDFSHCSLISWLTSRVTFSTVKLSFSCCSDEHSEENSRK